MTNRQDTCEILLIEDSEEDVYACRRACKEVNALININYCHSGHEGFEYLLKQLESDDGCVPDIILLDLNLPGEDGRSILIKIKQHQQLQHIPVTVLTTSNDPQDIHYCYKHGANSYIQKPVKYESYKQSIKQIYDYWFTTCKLDRQS